MPDDFAPGDMPMELAEQCLAHIMALLQLSGEGELPPELARVRGMSEVHEKLVGLRRYLSLLAEGDISQEIVVRGFLAGLIKAHISNLRHMTWQADQVSKGDFSQRLDFLGDFSTAFNHMTEQLDRTIRDLHSTQASLTQLTKSLRHEVELRTSAVQALKQSKARFKYLANHDPLTGALNRRSFLTLAEAGMRQAQQAGLPCCVAMLDVDHFKVFNDSYGHPDGDKALKHVVEMGVLNLRQKDSMGRYGGEEFIFFFADAPLDVGMAVAERILRVLRDTPLQLDCGEVHLTASMGVSVVLPEWEGERNGLYLQRIVGMADAALYEAKRQGRDRACAAPVTPPPDVSNDGASSAFICRASGG